LTFLPKIDPLEDRCTPSLAASASFTSTPNGANYNYTISLNDTGTTNVGTFWFAWIPGQDYMANNPISVVDPTGWTHSITGGTTNDGYAIRWVAGSGSAITAGNSLTFNFTSAETPSEMSGNSQFFNHPPEGTSFVYIGAPFGDSGDQFVVNAVSTTSVTSNPVGPITQGTSVNFTATVAPAGNVGTVSFYFDYGQIDQIQIGGAVSVSNGSATSAATTALPAGSDLITAVFSGGTGFLGSQGTDTIQVNSANPPPSITDVVIDQNISALYNAAGQPFAGAQRSMVNDIVYTFSEPVNILAPGTDPNVFTVAVASGWTGTVPTLSWASFAGSGNTQWAVTFSGSGVVGGSIANGAYAITVSDPGSITAVSDSQALTVTAGLAPGTGNPGYATQQFYRLFGDINGDGFVNASDNAKFKQALSTYNAAFDYSQDGFVNAADNAQFKNDLALSFSGFAATI
jgi:Bacterial Ig-like domain (group 3)/Dockerin type I domain